MSSFNPVHAQPIDPSLYHGPIDVAKKIEDPHEKMRELLTTPTHVDSLREQSNIAEMPEELEKLLDTEPELLEKALSDYMAQHGIHSMTFINLDDNGNVASIVTVTRPDERKQDLDFKQSARSLSGELDNPYTGNLNNYRQVQDFIDFTHPKPAAACNKEDSGLDQPVTTRKPHVAYPVHNREALEKITGIPTYHINDDIIRPFTDITHRPNKPQNRNFRVSFPDASNTNNTDTENQGVRNKKNRTSYTNHKVNHTTINSTTFGDQYENSILKNGYIIIGGEKHNASDLPKDFKFSNIKQEINNNGVRMSQSIGTQSGGVETDESEADKKLNDRMTQLGNNMRRMVRQTAKNAKEIATNARKAQNPGQGMNNGATGVNINQTFTTNPDGTKTVFQSVGNFTQKTTINGTTISGGNQSDNIGNKDTAKLNKLSAMFDKMDSEFEEMESDFEEMESDFEEMLRDIKEMKKQTSNSPDAQVNDRDDSIKTSKKDASTQTTDEKPIFGITVADLLKDVK